MKIVMQKLRTGETYLEELPIPMVSSNYCLVQSVCSLVSPGTEKMLVQFGKANVLDKIRQQPEKFNQALQKIKNDGLLTSLEFINSKLDQPIALGYSNVGIVKTIGNDVSEFSIGDRVVCNGYHAEFNSVSKNLCVKIPDEVTDEEAAFTMLGSIALQGVRLAEVQLGEKVAVIGLGLIGILACQILKANGCEVFGIDVSEQAINKAESFGIQCYNSKIYSPQDLFNSVFSGIGVDAVLITASAKENLVNDAATLCRIRGRIILLGVIGNEIQRDLFYKKELRFQVSCSYGPGRYDPNYEEKAIDYPIGYVRWTEKRNMEAILHLMANKSIDVNSLISKKVDLENAIELFYNNLDTLVYGNLIQFSQREQDTLKSRITISSAQPKGPYIIGLIGSGSFCSSVILPSLKKHKPSFKILASSQPGAIQLAKKYGFHEVCSDPDLIWNDPEINLVIIANRHHLHGACVLKAINSGKDIFVEKPLTIYKEELEQIRQKLNGNVRLVVGFNRRFSKYISLIKKAIHPFENSLNINYTINAGFIPENHWVHDPAVGGGRILGEVCHFVDLCNYFTESRVEKVNVVSGTPDMAYLSDNVSIQLKYKNGSIATIQYYSNGSKKYKKENIQLFFAGHCIELSNFKTLKGYGINFPSGLFSKQDKGHEMQFRELLNPQSIFFGEHYRDQVLHATEICFQIVDKLQQHL